MRARALTDPEEITLRARDVVIGGVLGIATAAAVIAYVVQIDGSSLEEYERERPIITRTGETRWISWSGRVVPTPRGAEMVIAGEDITAQRVAQEHVRHMAYHDGLTGLANRTKLEFMLLLADIDGDATATARRVVHDVLATFQTPFTLEGHEFAIAASVGAATFPGDGRDLTQLLKRADGALYDAKRDGRGTIRFAVGEPAHR